MVPQCRCSRKQPFDREANAFVAFARYTQLRCVLQVLLLIWEGQLLHANTMPMGHGLNAAVPPSSSHEWLRPRLGYWSCSRSLSKPPSFFTSMPAVFAKVLTLSGRSWIGASVLQIDLSSSPSARL